MVQTPTPWSDRILCCYVNTTTQLQQARIEHVSGGLFERLVFPQQRLLFEAVPDAVLEIYIHIANSASLLEQIPCLRLQVNELPAEITPAHPDSADLSE
ncbi:DUF1830 domain-containing protein [Leptolyngbya sp. FACHB-36]|uniref:DUF1830 domain-containing protein n=1 Tax=Leptolyngbya sp. FACHB-36 TaxID=2692808 RepID=UPI0016813C22|nr:DUF1830 domain-containing protein [Leptolyngbya sp. FACHB-36]MBD2021499.1 DUF1830 domain-containing protein [Leptolyngbya sp. FACHB-36]